MSVRKLDKSKLMVGLNKSELLPTQNSWSDTEVHFCFILGIILFFLFLNKLLYCLHHHNKMNKTNKTKQNRVIKLSFTESHIHGRVIINIIINIIVVVVIVTKDCFQMSTAVGKRVWSVALEAMINETVSLPQNVM